jgi:hypothetical protein
MQERLEWGDAEKDWRTMWGKDRVERVLGGPDHAVIEAMATQNKEAGQMGMMEWAMWKVKKTGRATRMRGGSWGWAD